MSRKQSWLRWWGVLVCLGLVGCSKEKSESPTDLWVWPGVDSGPKDLAADCPVHPDGIGATGWTAVQIADVPLHDVACALGHVYIAGDKATLLHRAPGDALCGGFQPQQVPTQADLLTVSFADLSYGATAGKDPKIWQTTDAGTSWTEAPQCGDVKFSVFNSLHLHAANKGFGVGATDTPNEAAYKIYAGTTWICPDQTFASQSLLGTFRLVDYTWLVGDTKGRIYHTPDEGSTWFYTDTGKLKPLRAVAFTKQLIGLAVGDEGVILRSNDGTGIGWDPVMTLGTDDLYDVYFWDEKLAWTVGDNGTIMHSADAGVSWNYQVVPTAERIEAICFTSASEGWAVGAEGTILHTTSGGI
jgi:photosystem II stability/assembly factor-like uncharacterized protein